MAKHLFAKLANGSEYDFGALHADIVSRCTPVYADIWVAKIVLDQEKSMGIDNSQPCTLTYELREPQATP